MKEKKTIEEMLRDMRIRKDDPRALNKEKTLKEQLKNIFLDPSAVKFMLTGAMLAVIGLGSWLFYSTELLPRRIEKYKTLQTQIVTLAEDEYYKEADQLSEKLQRKLSNSSNNELLEIYNDIRRFDDEKIDPFTDFKRLEQLVDKQKWRQADELAQNLLKSSEGNRNLLNEYLPDEYESLFDYYQSKIKPIIDDLNEETLIADGKNIYWSNKDNTKKRLILEVPKKVSHVSLSPDNRHIAFLRSSGRGNRRIYVADIDGNKLIESDKSFGGNATWVEDYPPFWVDNDTFGFKFFWYNSSSHRIVKSYVVDIDEHNNIYNLRAYNPKK